MNGPRYRKPIFALQYDLSEPDDEHLDDASWYRERVSAVEGPILEIGAGTGRITAALADAGARGVASDIGHAMLTRLDRRLASSERRDPGFTSVATDCRTLSFADASFAAAVCAYNVWGCLDDPADLERSLADAHRVLRKASPLWFDVAIQQPRDFTEPKRFSWQAWTAADGTRIRRRTTVHPRPDREWLALTYEYEWREPTGTRGEETVEFGLNTWPLDRYLAGARGAGFRVDHVDTKSFDGPVGKTPIWAFVTATTGS